MNTIDLRSDTVTLPDAAMRKAMAQAELGDDVYGEDPTVNRLQELGAEMLGTQAALFAPSGTQTNLIALMTHCQRGDEYLVGQQAHTYKYEGGGAAVLGSIQPQPLEFEADGTLDLAKAAAAIKEDDPHFARTRLLCLENTQAGRALPMGYLAEARAFADRHGLALHLDGARLFNAAVKHGVPASRIAGHFDSVSVCLSKGLGSPVGSLLCASREFVARALRIRKLLGGGMRQAGVVAAAGIHALQHNVERLAEDHENARRLADGLRALDGLRVDFGPAQTNMVFVEPPPGRSAQFCESLAADGVRVTPGARLRLVTHLGVSAADVERVVRSAARALAA